MEDLSGVILLFFLTALISAYGSLQLGPVNGAVLRYCFRAEFRAATWLALGGCLPELLYSGLAIWGWNYLVAYEDLLRQLQWALIPVFAVLGLRMLLIARKQKKLSISESAPKEEKSLPLLEGLWLGLLNPQLPLFWISMLAFYSGTMGISPSSLPEKIAFVLATASGAFGLLCLLIQFSRRQQKRLEQFASRFHPDWLIGWFFILISAIQLLRMLWNLYLPNN